MTNPYDTNGGEYGRPDPHQNPFDLGSNEASQSPAGESPLDAGNIISRAFDLFKNNPVPWILWLLAFGAVLGGISFLTSGVSVITSMGAGAADAYDPYDTTSVEVAALSGGLAVSLLSNAVIFLLATGITYAVTRGALLEVDGRKPGFADFLSGLTGKKFLMLILGAILVQIAVMLGLIAVIIGAVVVAFLTYWTSTFIIDRDMNAVEAIKASFQAISSQWKELLLLAVFNQILVFLGALACLIGLLVAIPVVAISSALAYRTVTGPSAQTAS